MRQIVGSTVQLIEESRKGATYHRFWPPRKPEEYVGQPGPHNGLALEHYLLEAIGQSRVTKRPHPYIVVGEWVRRADGVRFLDIAIVPTWGVRDGQATVPPQ